MVSRFSIIGLGKLGACMAACVASKGFRVVGVDANPKTVEALGRGQAPVTEPGLDELISSNRERLFVTSEYTPAVTESDVTFIVVPTPSEEHGGFSLRHVAQVAREIGRALRAKSDYHIVAVTSTVLPGSTEFGILPILERESGKVCGRDFGLCYNPEFIALGTVIRDFLSPDFVLIGESDERAGNELEAFYRTICDNAPRVARMNFVNAELTKIAVNTFVTTKIAFANMLAELCERLPGGDVDVVTEALGLDSRIGRRYLKGGLGYGGPCFPRDNLALGYIARQVGCRALLAESTDGSNQAQGSRLLEMVRSHSRSGCTVAVLGLSYKPHSDVVDESQGLSLARELAQLGYRVVVFDPLAIENAHKELNHKVTYSESVRECLAHAETVVIANPDPAFASIAREDLVNDEKGTVTVVDCWRLLRGHLQDAAGVRYIGLGIGNHTPNLAAHLEGIWSSRKK